MEDLLTIFYNGHFTQMTYPSQVEKQLSDYGLPLTDIDVLQYPDSKVIAPFHVDADQNLILLTEQTPPAEGVTPMNLKSVLEDIKKSAIGLKFLKAIMENNKLLKDNGLAIIPIEFEAEDTVEPSFYSVDEKVEPIPYLKKGVQIRDYKTGKKI
jgi:hypothetical protein